jgi:DUF4097 and DUF4098 domain-containing protein YvlB
MAMFTRASAILLVVCAGTMHGSTVGIPRGEFRASYTLAATGRITIHNLYGDVQIVAWDRDEVLVQATKHSTDPRRLDDAQIVVDSSNESVSIRTQYTGADAEHPASVEYHIMVPRRANLENIRLINGVLSISGTTGPVKASSVNGSIKADKLSGQADLSTVNGSLEAGFDRLSKCQPISLTSVNGPIRLSLPAGAGASVTALNLSGGIDSDFGRAWRAPTGHRLDASVNGGGAPIRLHNVNGGISIHSSWSRRLRPVS